MRYSYDFSYFETAAEWLRKRIVQKPEIALVLGSSLGPLAEQIKDPVSFDYAEIPNFLISTVSSHAGKLIFGTLADRQIVCMSGRFHSYEGYDFEQLVIPVRVLKLLGVKAVILTNAAGGVCTDYRAGDIMIIKDHIKLNGNSPLRGPNVEEFGPRFFDVSNMYTTELRELAKECGKDSGLTLHEGVYMFMPGPQFETPAEIRAIRILGGDAVGMSTVTEALTAAHCGMKVLAFSVITNMAAGVLDRPLTTEEVDDTAETVSDRFSAYIEKVIGRITL
ncbi:MAG TPA: purine-nucleoside phosphorylase [Erysipelotrichaceae bacterium]|nr:purine-nucleoside phosphorylase [Erysipelotrichaceae bacterium]